jgi:uncharacterized protein (TIGR02145 family)
MKVSEFKVLIMALAIGMFAVSCGDDDGDGDTAVTFVSVTADGSSSQTTTQLTLTFSGAIAGITADDVTLSGGVTGVTKGTLSGAGTDCILPVSGFTAGGTLDVAVAKKGYAISGSPKTVTVYYVAGSGGGGDSDGVEINGVTWATRNVGAPGAFAATSGDFGMLYRWNSRTGWSATDPLASSPAGQTWNPDYPTDAQTWAEANDPSPDGWRAPTVAELQALSDRNKVTIGWVQKTATQNEGYTITDKTTGKSIFLPNVPNRAGLTSTLSSLLDCWYWSSQQGNAGGASYLLVTQYAPTISGQNKGDAIPVRPVKKSN